MNSRRFDHLVGDREQCWGHLQAKTVSRLQVDDEFESRRLDDRKVAGFSPLRMRPT
jgi:hypothetical protein